MWIHIDSFLRAVFDVWYVGEDNTICFIKEVISSYHVKDLQHRNYVLIKNNKKLSESKTLREVGVHDGDTLYLSIICQTGI
jgi:hypothetical protein